MTTEENITCTYNIAIGNLNKPADLSSFDHVSMQCHFHELFITVMCLVLVYFMLSRISCESINLYIMTNIAMMT